MVALTSADSVPPGLKSMIGSTTSAIALLYPEPLFNRMILLIPPLSISGTATAPTPSPLIITLGNILIFALTTEVETIQSVNASHSPPDVQAVKPVPSKSVVNKESVFNENVSASITET